MSKENTIVPVAVGMDLERAPKSCRHDLEGPDGPERVDRQGK